VPTSLCWELNKTLHVTLQCSHYPHHGATDWIVWFENSGTESSGILSDTECCMTFSGAYPVLKGILGDHTNWYRPYAMDLTSVPAYFESNSGRPTHIHFPYFNLEYGDGGVMLAIGWSGTWRADFRYDRDSGATTYKAKSVNRLRTRLKPGEKIRTALFVCAPYQVREENYATNYWRSWFIGSNLPRADQTGTPLKPFSTCCLASDTGLPNTDGSISERYTTWRPSLEKMIEEDVKVDFRWFDAGWYIAPNGSSPDGSTPQNDWHSTIGTWTLDPVKWPGNTFRESTDFARANGMKTLMWFEPERVCDPESLAKNYGYDSKWAIHGSANNIGDPDCLAWTLNRIKKTLTENRVEMYREDNNRDPGELWHYLDTQEGEDRCGITECKFIDAHYRMWDDIIACTTSYGGCGFVDSCASGGGRNDLESLRRGIPLLRSDYDRTSTAIRLSMTTAFNKWIPFCGAINKEKGWQLDASGVVDQYVWRASYLPVMNVDSQFIQDPEQDFGVLRTGLREWKRVNVYLLKDFYVLTHWHTEEEKTDFTAYSFYDPETNEGVILAFRQEECRESVLSVTLPYVSADEVCTITDEDSGDVISLTGGETRKNGFTLTFDAPRSARLFWVKVWSSRP
jgi:alpha-galactosidase